MSKQVIALFAFCAAATLALPLRTEQPASPSSSPLTLFTGPYVYFPDPPNVKAIADFSDGVIRNFAISQGYFELSRAMTQFLGTEQASWPSYAAYASYSVGFGIRNQTLESLIELRLKKAHPILSELLEKFPYMRVGFYRQLMDHCTVSLAFGNMQVWRQVGNAISGLMTLFGQDTVYNATRVEDFVSTMDPRPAPAGELELMEAVRTYYQARFEVDERKKAQLIALANAYIGTDEQTTLQDALNGAFAPLVFTIAGKTFHIPMEGILTEMFTYDLPDEWLLVDEDMKPALNSSTDFPPLLAPLENAKLIALYDQFGAPHETLKGTAAYDWVSLQQRMKFILAMMRTRQMDKSLWHCFPFTEDQVEDIHKMQYPQNKTFCIANCTCDWSPIH